MAIKERRIKCAACGERETVVRGERGLPGHGVLRPLPRGARARASTGAHPVGEVSCPASGIFLAAQHVHARRREGRKGRGVVGRLTAPVLIAPVRDAEIPAYPRHYPLLRGRQHPRELKQRPYGMN